MRLIVLVVCAALLGGCALRPRYTDFITGQTASKEVTFLVTDAATSKPVPNARVEVSELKNRLQLITDADGAFKLPVERKYLEENPIILVTLPKGFERYRLVLAPLPAAPVEDAPSAPQGPPPPALESTPDAGTPASNG